MRGILRPVRTAVYQAVKLDLKYGLVDIPVYEEYLPAAGKKAKIVYNNQTVEVYVILLNQTSNNDTRLKCVRNDQSSIQIQVNTIFPSGTGGSELAEIIGDYIKLKIWPFGNDNNNNLQIDPAFNLWKVDYESARNIPYDTDTNRVWVHQMTFLCYVSQ